MVAGTGVLERRYGYVSTHNESLKKRKHIQSDGELECISFILFFFSIGFIFLYSSVLSIQGSPTSLSFTLFHQMILFHMRWFHSEHPLTVNLHTLTLQIHHHTGYVWAYRISAYSRFFQRQSCCYKPLGGTVVLEPDNSHFFSVLQIFAVLMKVHKINVSCERDRKSKCVKKAGNLSWEMDN